jgi:hypothetical protein
VTSNTSGDETGTAAPGANDAQSAVAHLRQTVLAGRGPGASRSEFLRNTRGRTFLGGQPVAQQRDEVARDAAAARRDADELLLHVAAASSRLSDDVAALRSRPERHAHQTHAMRALQILTRSRRIRFAVVGIVALMVGRSAWRRTR